MNLEKMLAAQKKLDERIVKEKGLEGKDLVANTYVALDVELGEMANEARWFKHWSNDQEPRKESLLEEYVDALHFFLSIAIQRGWEDILLKIKEDNAKESNLEKTLDKSFCFIGIIHHLSQSYVEYSEVDDDSEGFSFAILGNSLVSEERFDFYVAWKNFLDLGVHGFGFTLDQIEQAYFAKNKINQQRQEDGY